MLRQMRHKDGWRNVNEKDQDIHWLIVTVQNPWGSLQPESVKFTRNDDQPDNNRLASR